MLSSTEMCLPSPTASSTYAAYRRRSQLGEGSLFPLFIVDLFFVFGLFVCVFLGLHLIQRTLVRIRVGHVVGRWVREVHSID